MESGTRNAFPYGGTVRPPPSRPLEVTSAHTTTFCHWSSTVPSRRTTPTVYPGGNVVGVIGTNVTVCVSFCAALEASTLHVHVKRFDCWDGANPGYLAITFVPSVNVRTAVR